MGMYSLDAAVGGAFGRKVKVDDAPAWRSGPPGVLTESERSRWDW